MSSGYLLDTSVLSLLAPGRSSPDAALARWVHEHNDALHLSTVTLSEVEQAIRKLRRSGGGERAQALGRWLDALIDGGGDRILSLDARTGRIAGGLSDRATAIGRHPGFADIAIAATAIAHHLLLLTRNGKHFAPLGVAFNDPVEALPAPEKASR